MRQHLRLPATERSPRRHQCRQPRARRLDGLRKLRGRCHELRPGGQAGRRGRYPGPRNPGQRRRGVVVAIVGDIEDRGGGDVALLVNGLGATAYLDQYILYRGARRALEASGLRVVRSYVAEYITSLEMAGASVTVTLLDDELLALLDAPASTPRFKA